MPPIIAHVPKVKPLNPEVKNNPNVKIKIDRAKICLSSIDLPVS